MSIVSIRSIRAVALLVSVASACILSVPAFECGAPSAPCGENLPAGTTCPKGSGWCTAGHYCGYAERSSKAQCIPLPKNCGTAGNVCCPSNTRTPHTSETPPLERNPLCTDGSTRVFDPVKRSTSMTPDPYAGVEGEWRYHMATCLVEVGCSAAVLHCTASAQQLRRAVRWFEADPATATPENCVSCAVHSPAQLFGTSSSTATCGTVEHSQSTHKLRRNWHSTAGPLSQLCCIHTNSSQL
jgi:hypothetical protein